MPRKKRTKVGKPKMALKRKEIDEMSDVSICSTTSEAPLSKEEIVNRLLEDFQFSVENRIAQMRAMMNKAITDQRNLLKMELLKIPKDIRKMKVTEFISAGGDMDELMMNTVHPVDENVPPFESHNKAATALAQTGTSKRAATAQRARAAKATMLAPSVPQTSGRPTRGAKAKALATLKNQADMVTPMRGIPNVPVITPRVPLSSCMTAGRKPKQGGELTFSMAGSPVASVPRGKEHLINFSLKDGKPLDMSGSILDMSPNTLASHANKLTQFKEMVEAKLLQIEESTGYLSTKKAKPKEKSK